MTKRFEELMALHRTYEKVTPGYFGARMGQSRSRVTAGEPFAEVNV